MRRVRSFVLEVRGAFGRRGAAEAPGVPEEFRDPISADVMTDPVRLPSGNVVDRATIVRCLQADPVDPFSRAPLSAEQLQPDGAGRRCAAAPPARPDPGAREEAPRAAALSLSGPEPVGRAAESSIRSRPSAAHRCRRSPSAHSGAPRQRKRPRDVAVVAQESAGHRGVRHRRPGAGQGAQLVKTELCGSSRLPYPSASALRVLLNRGIAAVAVCGLGVRTQRAAALNASRIRVTLIHCLRNRCSVLGAHQRALQSHLTLLLFSCLSRAALVAWGLALRANPRPRTVRLDTAQNWREN